MKTIFFKAGALSWLIACSLVVVTGCKKNEPMPKVKANYDQVRLVANKDAYAPMRVDADLQNAWGMAFAPSGPDWVNGEVTGLSFIFNTQGGDVRPPVAIPSSMSDAGGGHPSGIVFNGSGGFRLPNGKPARFIFVGTDGILSAWNGGNVAIKVEDNSATSAYTGLAIAADGADSFIYAADFRSNHIEVYDTAWNEVTNKPFTDPSLPSGYAPFNIQNVNNNLFVMYAKVADDGDEEKGAGFGFVDVYRSNGSLIRRFTSNGELNAPWGVAWAPSAFWANQKWDVDDEESDHKTGEKKHHNDVKEVILIGNFGDGNINAYDQDGEFLGKLRSNGKAIMIDGLWALSFAPATATSIDPNWLFFAAGPEDEADGLFGYIKRD